MSEDLGILVGTSVLLSLVILATVMIGRRMAGKLTIRQKHWWRVLHLVSITVYFSGVLGSLLLAVFTTRTTDEDLIYAAHVFIQYFDWFLIVPGAFASIITGLWLAVRTHWGFAEYYWVVAKWAGNVIAVLYGATFLRIWMEGALHASMTGVHPLENPAYLHSRELLFVGMAIALAILVVLTVISVFKPWRKRKPEAGLKS